MPVKPPPFTLRCPQCGWKKTIAPQSDALSLADFPQQCEKCGSEKLAVQEAGGIASTLAKWLKKGARKTFEK